MRLQSPGPPLFSASRPARRLNSNSSSASTRRIPILTARLTEAARAIGEQSAGRLSVTVFPNSQFGGDPEMLSQLRAGGIELLAAPSMSLSTLVPGLPSVGFAFQSL